MNDLTSFEGLKINITEVHMLTSSYAKGAVNHLLMARNWIIGYYIVEYEQNGNDRAKYGEHLLENLANSINIKGLERTEPVSINTGEKPPKAEELVSVTKWNRKHGRNFIIYGCLLFITMVLFGISQVLIENTMLNIIAEKIGAERMSPYNRSNF